jgi:hypothetical protein
MQHTGLGQRRFAQQFEGIGTGATGVDDHRFTGLPGGLQVQAEGCLLQLGGFRLVVIVQTGFTDRHHFRVIELMQQPVQRRRRAGCTSNGCTPTEQSTSS